VGTGSGAVSYAVSTYLKKLKKDDVVVMLFGDSGRAYLSKNYF
jgi:cysteine synthase